MNRGIIFDLDGTLWDSSAQVVPAWNEVLQRKGLKPITQEDMHGFMGKTIEHIAQLMFPDTPASRSVPILDECCEEERVYLRRHGGVLYPHLEETLSTLSKKYALFIVSNCHDGYIETFLDYHRLGGYFCDTECIGRTGKPKGENIKIIIERNNLDSACYIGDTQGDLDAADFAGIPFLYASYGFGSVGRDVPFVYELKGITDAVVPLI